MLSLRCSSVLTKIARTFNSFKCEVTVASELPGWAEVYVAFYTAHSRPCERFIVLLRLTGFLP